MIEQEGMMTEEEQSGLPAQIPQGEAVLAEQETIGVPLPGEEDEGVPPEEQEDPYAGRDVPGDSDEAAEEEMPPAEPPAREEPAPAPESPPEPEQAVSAGLPQVAPTTEQTAEAVEAKRRYWRRVLTGSAETVPDDVRQRAGLHDAGLTDEQREYRLLSTINRSWAADHLGVEREQVRSGWSRLREQLAKRFKVADDEQELFAALSLEGQDAPRRERLEALYEAHYQAALLGQQAPPLVSEPGEEELPYAQELAEAAGRKGKYTRLCYLPLAREVATGLDVFAALEQDAISAPRVLSAMPELARSVDRLAEMDEHSRQIVYAIAQAEYRAGHAKGDESLYRTVRRAVGRGATGMGIGVGQALTHATIATMDAMGSMLGETYGRSLHEGAKALDKRSRIVEETRRLLQEEIKPLKVSAEAGFASQLLVDAAGATPSAIAACCGGAGFATLGLSGMGEAVAAARLRAPEGSQWLQYLAGVVGGGIQASIYSGMSRVGGQMLSNAIGRFARASGRGAGGYTLSSLGVLGAMGLEEAKLLFAGKTAELAGLGTQELAARLEKTASNIDWREYGENAQDLELNLREAAMTLPFVLIASGRVALRHFRSRHAVLGDGHALQKWGVDEATRDAIMKEPDINRQGDMLREALRSSRRWSAPGFIFDAIRALRLLNTDYFQFFKERQAVVDFLKLPSQGGLVPRPPLVEYSAQNPEHVRLLKERHGEGEKVNPRRLNMALQLWDEWTQKAHIVPEPAKPVDGDIGNNLFVENVLPTSVRRRRYGLELMDLGSLVPRRMRPGGFYAPHAQIECMAMLRDRVAELHDLSYQVLLASFPLDALSHSTRSLEHLRQDGEKARASLLEAVGRSVLRRLTGVSESEALDELGKSVTNYFWRRRYSSFPPGWMSRVPSPYTLKLDERARATFLEELAELPSELRDTYRVALGFRSCASALYELMPMVPDFRTSLSRGLNLADSYVHMLSRELGVNMAKARGVADMLAPYAVRATDMRAYRLKNEALFRIFSNLTGFELESARGGEGGALHWRVRRPNGYYTHWHRRKSDAINDMVAHTALFFMPFSYDRITPLRTLEAGRGYDLNNEVQAEAWAFTGYDHLCRVALRDTARYWIESAPYALPGFDMGNIRHYIYLGGKSPKMQVMMREGRGASPQNMQVDTFSLSSPLRLAQARFRAYWLQQLNSGLLASEVAGEELVKSRVISPEEWARVKDIAKPPKMPRGRNTPLKLTPPPDIPGMNRALADHLTAFSMRYFLSHLDDMPLPRSAREWFRLASFCQLEPGKLPERAFRLSLKEDTDLFTCLHNRVAARELKESAAAVADLRRAEREGLLLGSPLVAGLRDAVGLNRAQNLEQAWCMEESGGEAMMSASLPFWRLMERPLEHWKLLGASEQDALKKHLDIVSRTELSPEVVEAVARGEKPDFLNDALRNLQEVLEDYPALHQYGLDVHEGQILVRRLVPEEPGQGEEPFAEPEYKRAPFYRGGPLQRGYSLGEAEPLPDFMREDARVLPALRLLEQLRRFPGKRPSVCSEGILWNGGLYGGSRGLAPRGLETDWVVQEPLSELLFTLWQVDRLQESLPEGETLKLFNLDVHGLGEKIDLTPLRHVTLYRSKQNAAKLCRLMPGEPESTHAAARLPYVVQSIAGGCLGGPEFLSKPEDMLRAYIPLEEFRRPYNTRISLEETQKKFSHFALDYTLSDLLSVSSQQNPQSGIVSLRELLLRFAEDSGFSRSLGAVVDPRGLRYGQVQALRLARELLLCVCGSEPEAAYQRLQRLGQEIGNQEDERQSVLRALLASSDELLASGAPIFRESRVGENVKEKKANEPIPFFIPGGEKFNLNEWIKLYDSEKRRLEEEPSDTDVFNEHVRPDGYSKGFFDD